MIYIDADDSLATWKHIAQAGGYTLYRGTARRGDIIIRWGANHGRYHYPEGVRILNSHLVLNKRSQYDAFVEANVTVPRIYTSRIQWTRDGSPQLLRKPAVGQMGTGIRLIDHPNFNHADCVYQQYIDKQREFRAMMVKDIIAFFMEKHRPANGDVRWNEHRGSEWTGVPPDDALRRRVRELASRAVDAIGYDFGAVDLILDHRNLYVLEVNSRPEFGPVNAARFARAIGEYLGRRR